MADTGAVRSKAWRKREAAKRKHHALLMAMLVDRVWGTDVRCSAEIQPDNIVFHWTGPQEHYAELEAFCQEHGFSFSEVMMDVQRLMLADLLPKHGMTLAGPGTWHPTEREKADYLAHT